MTNESKFVTAHERAVAFMRFCKKMNDRPGGSCVKQEPCSICSLKWLDLEAEEEKPFPCIWCKSKMQHIKEGSGHFLACVNCNHSTRMFETNEELVREYNRVAKKCREAKE